MRSQMTSLLTVARELEHLGQRHQLCASLRRFNAVMEPLLKEHRITPSDVTPPATRATFDDDLSKKFVAQAVKTSQAHSADEKVEVLKLYALFVKMMEQYCVSSREIESNNASNDKRAAS